MAEAAISLKTILLDTGRLLTFRRMSPAIGQHPHAFLAFGLFCTWLAGIGRYWDNPRATWVQHLGLGSVFYVFVLAAILWLCCWPLRPRQSSYLTFLTFVTLTSPPAILYAIPVERFTSLEQAKMANALFLAVVALWRVALLFTFLRRVAQFSIVKVVVASLLPLVLIVITLAALNLEHVVFNLMSGIDPDAASPNDTAYQVVFFIAYFSFFSSPLLGLAYLIMCFLAWRARKTSAPPAIEAASPPVANHEA